VLHLENSFLRFIAVDKNDADKILAQATYTLNMLRKGRNFFAWFRTGVLNLFCLTEHFGPKKVSRNRIKEIYSELVCFYFKKIDQS
jgi:hypothetical protein